MGTTTRIIVVRHGARFDYANPDWAPRAASLGLNPRDPPLSELGVRQAEQAAVRLAERLEELQEKPDAILVSPYLRVIMTAQPLARKLGESLLIEEGLSETHHCPNVLPSARERFAYFPEIDETYEPMHVIEADAEEFGVPAELYPESYMRRMMVVGRKLAQEFEGQTVVCYTHAASVCLVAGILNLPFPDDLSFKFAPCGIFELECSPDTDGRWELISNGDVNTAYITENDEFTSAWGFRDPHRLVWNSLIADLEEDKKERRRSKRESSSSKGEKKSTL
mmetsp:Transcript_3515/g.7778  ORF Transcript_3515/g.7778 Transcript_3515/m.7778 type:complete len:280 (-) Transcript_3515:347-1186(-)